jgi:hypothetical protein
MKRLFAPLCFAWLCLVLPLSPLPPFSALAAGAQSRENQPALDPTRPEFQARDILEALAEAWPGRISRPETLDGDLAVRLDDTWYRWAGGRLLPAVWKGDDAAYSPWPFYRYPTEQPPVRKLDAAEKKSLAEALDESDRHPANRYPAFYDQLWHSPDGDRAWDLMKTIRFLGREVLINPNLLEEVSGIERDLRALAAVDKEAAAWMASIGSVEGFAWRSVAGTRSRSMHSYGAAIDIVPSRSKSLSWYWLDARESGLPWYELPLSRRITVPDSVVKIFERYGFIWGGKWFFWDLVHFEYRPEILILNGQNPLYQKPIH